MTEWTVWCSDNYVGGLGAAVLANALQQNTALQELYIKGNELGNEGVKALCGALAQREVPFKVLDVGNNRSAPENRMQLLWSKACNRQKCVFSAVLACVTIVHHTQ